MLLKLIRSHLPEAENKQIFICFMQVTGISCISFNRLSVHRSNNYLFFLWWRRNKIYIA